MMQPVPAAQTFQGLMDTGATTCCISANVIAALGIKSAGMRPMGSATDPSAPTNTYIIDLAVIFASPAVISWWFPNLLVYEYTPPPNCGHEILLSSLTKGTIMPAMR
jgi:hypothetical protein